MSLLSASDSVSAPDQTQSSVVSNPPDQLIIGSGSPSVAPVALASIAKPKASAKGKRSVAVAGAGVGSIHAGDIKTSDSKREESSPSGLVFGQLHSQPISIPSRRPPERSTSPASPTSPTSNFSSSIAASLSLTGASHVSDETDAEGAATSEHKSAPRLEHKEGKESKALIGFAHETKNASFEYELTAKERFWQDHCLPLLYKAFVRKDYATARLYLGPKLYPIKQEYSQKLRDQRFIWLKASSKAVLYAAAKDVVRWYEEKLQRTMILNLYEEQVIEPLRKSIASFVGEGKGESPFIKTTEKTDIQQFEEVRAAHDEALDHYVKKGLKAYQQKVVVVKEKSEEKGKKEFDAPLKKKIEDYASHPWVKSKLSQNNRVLTPDEHKGFNKQLKQHLSDVETRLMDDFTQQVKRETTALLQMANEGITRADLVERYEAPLIEKYQSVLSNVREVFEDGDLMQNFQESQDLTALQENITQSCQALVVITQQFHGARKKLKEHYQQKQDAAKDKYDRWLDKHHAQAKFLSPEYAQQVQYDITIKRPVDEQEFDQLLEAWKGNHKPNNILFIFSPRRNYWKAYLINPEAAPSKDEPEAKLEAMPKKTQLEKVNFRFNVAPEMVKEQDIQKALQKQLKFKGQRRIILAQWKKDFAEIGGTPLQRFRNKHWSTLLHDVLAHFITVSSQDKEALKPLLELFIKHGCSPCARNHIKVVEGPNRGDVLRQNAFEYANSQLVEQSAEPPQQNRFLPDLWLLEITLKYMATYSPAEEEIRQVLLKFCESTQSSLNNYLASLFIKKLIVSMNTQSVAEITDSLYDARTEGCDSILFEAVWKQLNTPKSPELRKTALYKGLNSVMDKVSSGALMCLPVSERVVLKGKLQKTQEELEETKRQWERQRAEGEARRKKENDVMNLKLEAQSVELRTQSEKLNTQGVELRTQSEMLDTQRKLLEAQSEQIKTIMALLQSGRKLDSSTAGAGADVGVGAGVGGAGVAASTAAEGGCSSPDDAKAHASSAAADFSVPAMKPATALLDSHGFLGGAGRGRIAEQTDLQNPLNRRVPSPAVT